MSRLMIVVEFEVKPEHHDAFVELMKNHARLSRAEDGCQQFDVLLPQNDPSRVLMVEAWRDQAALDMHAKVQGWRRTRKPIGRGSSAARRPAASRTSAARAQDRGYKARGGPLSVNIRR